ncbi:MAG: hypothetical protein ABR512_05455 [Desulfopila sp.]
MAEIILEQEQENLKVFLTQKKLAQRWRVTEATIKNIRVMVEYHISFLQTHQECFTP